ncbi:MAG: hypothetical protein RRB13_06475 [bacterium]|nr:hypothetical protein [bacterium]
MNKGQQIIGILGGLALLAGSCQRDNGASAGLQSGDLVRSAANYVDQIFTNPDSNGNFGGSTNRVKGIYKTEVNGTEAFNTGYAWSLGYRALGAQAYKIDRTASPSVDASLSGEQLWRFQSGQLAEQVTRYQGVSTVLYSSRVTQQIDGSGAEVAYNAVDGSEYSRSESVALANGLPSSKTLTYLVTKAGTSLPAGQKLYQEIHNYTADPFGTGGWYRSQLDYYDGSTAGTLSLVGRTSTSRSTSTSGQVETRTRTTRCEDGLGNLNHYSATITQAAKTVTCALSGSYAKQVEQVVIDQGASTVTTSLMDYDNAESLQLRQETLETYANYTQRRLSQKTVSQYSAGSSTSDWDRTYLYDSMGQLVSDTYQAADGTGFVETYSYSAQGVLDQVDHWSDPSRNTKDRQDLYTQDSEGRIASKEIWDISGATRSCTGRSKLVYSYTQDSSLNLSESTETYACAAGGSAYEGTPASKVDKVYNSLGQLTSELSYTYSGGVFVLSGRTDYQYGSAHQLSTVQYYNVAAGTATATYQTRYNYDSNLFETHSVPVSNGGTQCLVANANTGSCTTACSAGVTCYLKESYSY